MSKCSFLRADEARLLARDTTLLYTEICAIQSQILAAIDAGKFEVCVDNNTPFTAINNIVSVEVTNGGVNYFPVEATAEIVDPTFTPGSGAILEVEVTGQTITAITVIDGGLGYDPDESEIVITHPTGFGFAGQLVIDSNNGEVLEVLIDPDEDEGGFMFAPVLPTAEIIDATGQGAVLEVEVDETTGEITAINVVSGGFGYSDEPDVLITAAPTSNGSGAEAEATVNFSPFGADAPQYYDVISGQSSDRVIKDQIQFILDYFTSLGYNIRPQVNPVTGNTLQWCIYW